MVEMNSIGVRIEGNETIQVSVSERGAGRTFLLLHGGGGPQTMTPFADRLAAERPARVITPTHPGFAGTRRPESLASVRELGQLYTRMMDELATDGYTVVGNSIGGWIAAEMALVQPSRAGAFVIVDGVGIDVPDHPIADFFSLTPRQVAELSYHDPDRYGIDPSKLPPAALQAMAGNRATLGVYAGASMSDPTLAGRLAGVNRPVLVLWGEADRIADVDYGRALGAAIPGARFELIAETGHLPQIEAPDRLIESVWRFAETAY